MSSFAITNRVATEGMSARESLLAVIAQPDTPFNNSEIGQKSRAILALEALDEEEKEAAARADEEAKGEKDSALSEVEAQLKRLLAPPLFSGATPATPFRIAALVNNELATHAFLYRNCMKWAPALLEQWFAEHPTDVLTERARSEIHSTCVRERSALLNRMRISVGQHAHSASAVLPAVSVVLTEDAQSVTSSTLDAVRALGVGDTAAAGPADTDATVPGVHFIEEHVGRAAEQQQQRMEEMATQVARMQQEMQLLQQREAAAVQQQAQAQQAAAIQQAQQQQQQAQAMQQQAQQAHPQGQLLGAHSLPRPPVQQQSPAAHINVPYGAAKEFISNRFQSTIISPMQQEIDTLRAQVDRLSGVLRPSDPVYQQIVRECQARFSKPGAVKVFDRRRVKLAQIKGDLEAAELHMGTLIEDIASLRLNAALYAQRVDVDDELRGEKRADKNERTTRWEEEAARRDQAARDRLKRDQAKLDLRAQPRNVGSLDRYAASFVPPQYAPAAFAPPAAFPQHAFAFAPQADANMGSDNDSA